MFGCKCLYWNNLTEFPPLKQPQTFSLPASLPHWPSGRGFASGRISLGDVEVAEITSFEFIWRYVSPRDKNKSVSFYKPDKLPDSFHCLGHYCQPDSRLLRGFVLVARGIVTSALAKPLDYTLVWSSNDLSSSSSEEEPKSEGCGYFWLPQPPRGYKPVGFLVTTSPTKPGLDQVRCVRANLTDKCEARRVIITALSDSLSVPLFIWTTRPSDRGMWGKGVSAGTFFCRTPLMISTEEIEEEDHLCNNIACLKNLDSSLHAMPNLDQIHALIQHYGPRVFFHPDEVYLPSSVSWFFKNGAVLCCSDNQEPVDENGSNLPHGGANDKQFWIDLPSNDEQRSKFLKRGDLETAKLYVHVKPAFGGTFTDLAFWIFCPFNGPATLKLGLLNISLAKTGQHVCDWEHFTLRISNFSGELHAVYLSQHSGGEWVEAQDLEFVEGSNRAVVYSSKHGHASFARSGMYLQGSDLLGIGIRNDTARSDLFVDSCSRYEVVAAEYLGEEVVEPPWLGYMREWGPKIVYGSRTEIERLNERLPWRLRCWVDAVLRKLPVELSGEEGPTGPKEKNNWFGDERW
ncbi:hypothetical protein Rs2_28517 [Raphanus sativus]|uniref:Vacuolar protein sorting-associated protein 62 n=1 Tax=Raphanus sativus TaxID=3726 RepID=A0A6J0JCR0_RAPSA|nr:hypothetical protein At1g04090 [Raphanus sativus]KAJ4888769.1 hypothetical protein Rs2_28517 [Raphanus sativus]